MKGLKRMKCEKSVKILVGCHNPAVLLKSEVLVPIHLGRALGTGFSKDGMINRANYQWMIDHMIGDDTGDNISIENRYLNELTAIYWAWKNQDQLGNPDYIGFMHYRRHLSFNLNKKFNSTKYGVVEEQKIDDEYISKYHLDDFNITNVVCRYDVVVAERTDLKKLGTLTPYNHYENSEKKLHIKDYERVLDILNRKYPEYAEDAVSYNNGDHAFFTNVFVMKKDIYNRYCEWLFDILGEAREQVDISGYNVQEARALAYIAEWLCGIYITRLIREGYKVCELQETLVYDTDILPEIKPAFAQNNIPVCLSTDENYVLYTGVAVQSIIDNASERYNYDIIILAKGVPPAERSKLLQLIAGRDNFSIRFVDIQKYISKVMSGLFFTAAHFSEAVYYRIFISKILTGYDKVLYIDSDLVVTEDIANLYHEDIKGEALGAVIDTEIIRMYHNDVNITAYVDKTLGLKTPACYFNSGVLIMSLEKIRTYDLEERFIAVMSRIKSPYMVDQDILNVIFEGDVHFLDGAWNYEYHLPIWSPDYADQLPFETLAVYQKSRENAKIVHFAGSKKPWRYPQYDMAGWFWKYARRTPFYEEILFRNLSMPQVKEVKEIKEKVGYVDDYLLTKLKYAKYKLLSKIMFGRKRKMCRQKRKELKRELKRIKGCYRMQEQNAQKAA